MIRTSRPRQWLKNASIFAAPIFAGTLFTGNSLENSIRAFIVFSMLSSGAYFLNDIIDAPKDRLHPIKKNRPIASGKLSSKLALIVSMTLILSSIVYSYIAIGEFFSYFLLLYILMQFSYSFYFRNVIILDSMLVASGFVIRVFAGGLATQASISSWLALTTIGISLLMAFGKRRSEKTILKKFEIAGNSDIKTRQTLKHYPDNLLDSMISMSAAYTILTYSLFTFQISPEIVRNELAAFLPSILRSPKWMMLTIPLVIYGVARYLYVIYEKGDAESPERVLLSDRPLFLTVMLWGVFVVTLIYVIPLVF